MRPTASVAADRKWKGVRWVVWSAVLGAAMAVPSWTGPHGSTLAYGRGGDGREIELWLPRAERGEATAQYAVGMIKLYLRRDFASAAAWLRRAAEKGEPRAQYLLSTMLFVGLGLPRSDTSALIWCRRAAAQGLPIAEYYIGAAYYFGVAVKPDRAEAAKWFLRAAQSGVPMARVNLGVMYLQGTGIAHDHVEAAKWYRRAAEQSVGSAVRSTGLFFVGLDAALSNGTELSRLEAALALAAAKRRLGVLYAHGWGVPRDPVRAYMWLHLAAAHGDGEAAKLRNALAREMTSEQVAESRMRARKWTPEE